MMGIYVLSSLVEVVNVVVLFKIHLVWRLDDYWSEQLRKESVLCNRTQILIPYIKSD